MGHLIHFLVYLYLAQIYNQYFYFKVLSKILSINYDICLFPKKSKGVWFWITVIFSIKTSLGHRSILFQKNLKWKWKIILGEYQGFFFFFFEWSNNIPLRKDASFESIMFQTKKTPSVYFRIFYFSKHQHWNVKLSRSIP